MMGDMMLSVGSMAQRMQIQEKHEQNETQITKGLQLCYTKLKH